MDKFEFREQLFIVTKLIVSAQTRVIFDGTNCRHLL